MKIYTKKGDKGETSIFSKKGGKEIRLSKADPLIDTIGVVDEVNSYLGVVLSEIKNQKSKVKFTITKSKIEDIQRNLFTIGAVLAGANLTLKNLKTKKLEIEIDKMEEELPKLTNFILPGGSVVSAHLMYARALVRRAERSVAALSETEKISPSVLKYLNRLSDYLFILARYQNLISGRKEKLWGVK